VAYSEELANRIRDVIGVRSGVGERKMFGGVGWMIGGNMACAAMASGDLMVRVGKEQGATAAGEPGARAMVHGGRTMTGFVVVEAAAVEDDGALTRWVDAGADYAAALPPK
jgi:TfoX/Sxy family transcriptional regulator of competence genes